MKMRYNITIVLYSILLVPVVVGFTFQRGRTRYNSLTTCRSSAGASHQDSSKDSSPPSKISVDSLAGRKVLVVGGSGRVGGSVVTQLLEYKSRVTVGGTSVDSFERAKGRKQWNGKSVDFQKVNKEDADSIAAVLNSENYDLVVHTAGPFQGKVTATNGILEACVNNKVPYVDVCDDYCTAMAAKAKYAAQAEVNKVPCIVSTGCWPGVSSLMAKQLIRKVLKEDSSLKPEDLSVDFSFFTAGSGGAGATLLVATFLILAEEALTIVNGRRQPVKAMKEYKSVWFGDIVGRKEVANLNLLETASIHDILGVANVKSLFGTAPGFWNSLLGLMAQLPPSLLANEELMSKLAVFSLPIVRLVDAFAGATNAMKCDVTTSTKDPAIRATALYAHENLEPCVGECIAAFCAAVLTEGVVPPGILFPEEAIAGGADAAAVLGLASVGAHTVEVDSNGIEISYEEVWGHKQATHQPVLQSG